MTWPYKFSLSELMQRAAEQDAKHTARELGRVRDHVKPQKPKVRKPRPKKTPKGRSGCIWCGTEVEKGTLVCPVCVDLENDLWSAPAS